MWYQLGQSFRCNGLTVQCDEIVKRIIYSFRVVPLIGRCFWCFMIILRIEASSHLSLIFILAFHVAAAKEKFEHVIPKKPFHRTVDYCSQWCNDYRNFIQQKLNSGCAHVQMLLKRKLRLSAKLPHQEIRWNCGILRSVQLKIRLNTFRWSTIPPK